MLLDIKKVTISFKYADYTNIFSIDCAAELPKYTGINDYSINLIDNKQPPYSLIYSLKLIKIEILKTYIKTNLVNSFIQLSKLSVRTPILFIYKKNSSL